MMNPHFPSGRTPTLATLKGGIGDVLMIANACAPLVDQFIFCVEDYQIPLLERVRGCTPKRLGYYADLMNRVSFEHCVNFMYFLTVGHALRSGDYYSILEERIGRKVEKLAGFDFHRQEKGGIYIHISASNPNRDWLRESWEIVIPELSKLDTVYLLGRASEFSVRGPKIKVLSDKRDDLLWQTEQLATARYFVGVDSGFCHIAGTLGVPGNVLFFNTCPADVIGRYSSLTGLDAFEGNEPSRTTKVPCPVSEKYKKSLSPETLINAVQTAYN